MNISDFLPKYPNINQEKKDILNPYENNFYESLFRKKEFYDERYEKNSKPEILSEKGQLMKHQKLIARFLSSHTMYDSLLLVHSMGSGKTCSAIGAIEQIKSETSQFKGAYIFAKGVGLLDNFIKELRDKCTGGQYVPEGFGESTGFKKYGELSEKETVIRTRKLYEEYYHFKFGKNKPTTFQTFTKHLRKLKDDDITSIYSNHIIVLDEVHNLREKGDDSEKMYDQFHRFLHLIKNCKILLLSGTPMKDTPDEISSVMNLLLPLDKQLPVGDIFLSEFLDNKGENLYTVKKNKIQELKESFKGRVSFVKSVQSSIKKKFIGNKEGKLKHLIVKAVNMSEFQTKAYENAINLDSQGNVGVYYNARQASLLVFPDGTYGQGTKKGGGFDKYVTKTESTKMLKSKMKNVKPTYSYKLNPNFIKELKGKDNEETLKNLEKYSCKYADVIRSILITQDKCCFIYSELVTGSGSIIFSKILELFTVDGKSFTEANGKESTNGLRYALLTFKTAGPKKIHNIINRFNRVDNMHGNIIKILIGSKVVSEGVSFSNIQEEYILTPWFNYSETDQAIARGIRLGSHKALLNAGGNPTVYISQMVAIPTKSNSLVIDLYMYEIAEDKDVTIQGILRLLMESAFDCVFNYYRNHSNGVKMSRDCEYKNCDYVCDGIDMKNIDGLNKDEIDYSTYQLYYSDPKVNSIRKRLDKLFKKYNELDFKTIFNILGDEYSEQEVKNALIIIFKNTIFLKDYEVYSKSNVKKIMNKIEKLFQVYFRLSFDNIIKNIKGFTQFEILTALKNIIDENIIIKNKYGFTSYMKEDKNIYFLVNSLSVKSDSFSDYYSRSPNILNDKSFENILYETQTTLMPIFIKKLCKITNSIVFSKLIKTIPEEVQELFIETAILSKQKNKKDTLIRQFVLEYFVNYINQIGNMWVSNKLNDGETLRCLTDEKWDDCDETYEEKIKERDMERKGVLEQNPWGYYGKYNPEKNTFNIVNVNEQIKKQKQDLEEKTKELDEFVKSGDITEQDKEEELKLFSLDSRNIYSGKNCKNWGKPLLQKMIITVFKLDYPEDFKKNTQETKLRDDVKKINDKIVLYKEDELKELSIDDLKRVLYWTSKENKIQNLCEAIKKWFSETKWDGFNMLIPDKQAGTYGHKKKEKETDKEKIDFRILTIIPINSPEEFKQYSKDIEKLMDDCFNIKKYKAEISSYRWVFIFRKKKIVGFFIIDTKNVILNVCIGKNYRRKGIGKLGIQTALGNVCPGINPKLFVDNRGNTYTKLIKMYTDFGFTIVSNDEKTTTMEFKC